MSKSKTKANVGTMAADHAKFAAPGKPARVAARRKKPTSVRTLLDALHDRYEMLEDRAGRDRLWILADEYRVRATACDMVIEHLVAAGFDVDAKHELD